MEMNCPSCGSSMSLIDRGVPVDRSIAGQARIRRRIAHFELIEQLGVGAFGSVWKAKDTLLDTVVAVKIPRSGQLDAEEAERFIREARAAAQLHHANIVGVQAVGRDGDQLYIVSELIDGLPLDQWRGDRHLGSDEAAGLCAKIADALDYAHEHGVIHRDLKPQNILIDDCGGPHVTDFGLAKREVGEMTMTIEGQVLGTPAYLSPEQAAGHSHAADRRSDVYSLGVVLFELLTGERPFRGSLAMLLRQHVEDDAPSPRRLVAGIPRDLETICIEMPGEGAAAAIPVGPRAGGRVAAFSRQGADPRPADRQAGAALALVPAAAGRGRAGGGGGGDAGCRDGDFVGLRGKRIRKRNGQMPKMPTAPIKRQMRRTEALPKQRQARNRLRRTPSARTSAKRAEQKAKEALEAKKKTDRQLALSYIDRGVNELQHGDPARGFAILGQAYRATDDAPDLRLSVRSLLGAGIAHCRVRSTFTPARDDRCVSAPMGRRSATESADKTARLT